ncbi:MAG: DUF885 domain-containing protein [Anaerolineae bacterium]|nr:DUF885 domain-containing protein [Gloeobacterales cyanobacterium ES-bin-313]
MAEQPLLASPASKLGEQLLDEYFRRDPVFATSAGDHRFDGLWPNCSPTGLESENQWILGALKRIDRVLMLRIRPLPDDQVDLDLLRASLELLRYEHEVGRSWFNSPLFYSGIIGSGLDDLVSRDFASAQTRAASVVGRLEGLPRFIDQAIANLRQGEVLQPQAKVAVGQLTGLLELINKEIPDQLAAAPASLKKRIASASPAAIAAVTKFRDITRDELLPKATGEWRLGKEKFARVLKYTLQSSQDADALYEMAKQEHEAVRIRMAQLAKELYLPLFGTEFLSTDTDDQIIRKVLEALALDHVQADQFRTACEENLKRLGAFVRSQNLLPLDSKEVLKVIWTPPSKQGVAIAGLSAPAPLDAAKPGLPSFYLVQPLPNEWTPQRKESFLREYNNFLLEILSIHEAIPGHFVQGYYAKRVGSKVRRVLGNGAFIEGWGVYAERMMVEAGYAGAEPVGEKPKEFSDGLWKVKQDPSLRAKAIALHGQKFYLRTVTNAILDHAIHVDGMDETAAVSLMVDKSFQQEGEAHAKWTRAQVSAGQLSTYFVGLQDWLRLREQAKARAKAKGQVFNLSAYHAAVLSHGSPSISQLPKLLGWS